MKGKNIYREELEAVLARLDQQNITTRQQLLEQELLHQALWVAAENFVSGCALRSKTHASGDGQIRQGNFGRLEDLKEKGVDPNDVRQECLIHIFENLDRILKQPPAVRCNYIFTMVNNRVVDVYRGFYPVLSLDEEVGDKVFGSACRRKDLIAGPATPEETMILRQAVLEGLVAARETQLEKVAAAREVLRDWTRQERARLRQDMRSLRDRPAEAFARLFSWYLDMKPGQAADLLFLLGPDGAYEALVRKVARVYGIGGCEKTLRRPVRDGSLRLLDLLNKMSLEEIWELKDQKLSRSPRLREMLECFAGEDLNAWEEEDFLLLSRSLTGGLQREDVKLDTGDKKLVCAQLSRLAWRAGDRLEKKPGKQYIKK